MRVP
ncbi:hypothetical protein YPPY88_1864, partial [Yersinia pestis PY-88]|jgi:hypothetical protein